MYVCIFEARKQSKTPSFGCSRPKNFLDRELQIQGPKGALNTPKALDINPHLILAKFWTLKTSKTPSKGSLRPYYCAWAVNINQGHKSVPRTFISLKQLPRTYLM